uniref:Uncharacterized protein n=1 Tax=Loxodonta africana TaxID=9785 RepID=G3T661_LOXAF
SSPDEETEVPSRLLGQPEKDPVPFALSQNSGRKFVPQFAKARKTVTRKAETKEEDIRSGAFNLETLQEPSAPQTGSQQLHASPGLAFPEEGAPEDQAQATGIHPEQHSQLPPESVLGGGASLPMTSTDGSPSWRMVASASERASQKGPPRSSESEGKEPHRGAPQKEGEGVPGALGPDPARGLIPVSQGPEPGSAAQGCPNHMHMPSRPVVVVAKGSTDPTVPPPGAPEPARWAPNSSCSVALPHSLEAVGGPGEVGPEDEPPGDTLRPPAASQAPAHQSQEPTVGGGDSSPITLEVGPGVDLKQTASPGQEELGGAWVLPSPEPVGGKAAEPGSESQPDPEPSGCSLSLRAASPPEHTEVVDGLSQGPRAHTALDPADQAVWGCSSPMELDFLPDSQIQDALDAPNFEAPPEQESEVQLGWWNVEETVGCAGSSGLHGHPQWTQDTGNKAFEAPRLEDATDIVCGLIMELSNLNRLIMSTHRDLEAFKRLSYRKGKPAGKAPAPYASKGAGNLPGKQPWRDL